MTSNSLLTRWGGRFAVLLSIAVLPFALSGCDSQLDQETFGQIEKGAFPTNAEEFRSVAAATYAPLRGFQFSPLNLAEHTSDETMVPTRGGDWADGGQWRQLTQHEWSATHPELNPSWNNFQTGISRTNSVISSVAASDALSEDEKAQFAAEMRFMRAYYYYWLMDFFGGVPIVVEEGSDLDFPTQAEISTDNPPPHNTRKEVYDFILQELTGATSENISVSDIESPADGSALANLPPKGEIEYGRATQGAGYALLARLLLNSEVYAVSIGGPEGSGISALGGGPSLYQEAAAAADQVLNSPNYSLEDDYYTNFAADNFGSDEIIFAATFNAKDGQGFQKQQAMLHYNQPWKAGPWNGFTTIAEFYDSYDNVGNNEVRQNQFMAGPQYASPSEDCAGDECFSDSNSEPVTARNSDVQVDFTPEVPSLILDGSEPELESPGARPLKFELDPGAQGSNMGNDLPLFRLAEMYLIKAEALTAANGGPTGEAVAAFDMVRTRTGADALGSPPASASKMYQLILQERGFEFHFEMLRRQDQIRYEFAHGQEHVDTPNAPSFTGPWRFKTDSAPCRALFPIPENQLSVNPELAQNPEYPGCGGGAP